MPTLTLRGAHIRFVDLRYEPKSKSVYTKVNFTAVYSKPVRDEMEWPELPEGMPTADLEGEYTATKLTLAPNGLEASTIELEAKDMGGFSVHRVKAKDDPESFEEELRFQVVTPDRHAAKKLATYLEIVGHGEAQLKIKYNAQSAMENDAADKQEKLISEEQANDTKLVDKDAAEGGAGRPKTRAKAVN